MARGNKLGASKAPQFLSFRALANLSSGQKLLLPPAIPPPCTKNIDLGKMAWSIIYRDITSILLLIALRDILLSLDPS